LSLLHQRFEAHAVHPDHGNEVVQGEIVFAAHSVVFEAEGIVWEIPIERLVVEVRVGDEERIAFTDPAQPGVEFFADDFSLLDNRTIPALMRAREQLETRLRKREWNRRWKIVGYCAVVVLVLTWCGGFATTFMVRSIAAKVPAEWDQRFGSNAIQEFRAEEKFLDDTNAVAQLAAMAEPLLRVLPEPPNGYQFHIVEQEDPNAFALPGGHIVVNTGMLEMVDRPEQLLGVIAHEVAHVTERHGYRQQISLAGPIAVCELFLGGGHSSGAILSGGTALVLGADFSQEFENEADAKGWDYLVKANIDPRGMIETFQKFKQIPGGGDDFLPQALHSHPSLDKRISRLEAKWKKLPHKAGFVVLDAKPILKH
jgi:Zn-dependent protease with chaperone function